MRAVICRGFDGIDALELGELPEPVPGPGQVLVDVHVAALSFMDTLIVTGRYQLKPDLPFVPGSDAASVVLAVGDGVRRVREGDRVACSHWHGGIAERMLASESAVTRLPDGMDFEIASTVRYAYGTAYYALVRSSPSDSRVLSRSSLWVDARLESFRVSECRHVMYLKFAT